PDRHGDALQNGTGRVADRTRHSSGRGLRDGGRRRQEENRKQQAKAIHRPPSVAPATRYHVNPNPRKTRAGRHSRLTRETPEDGRSRTTTQNATVSGRRSIAGLWSKKLNTGSSSARVRSCIPRRKRGCCARRGPTPGGRSPRGGIGTGLRTMTLDNPDAVKPAVM